MMSLRARILVAIAALLLAVTYAVPLWQIRLQAPQYPEGIGMKIHLSDVRGLKPNDLDNINGLNHYIGMKPIRPDAIPELRWMPWIMAGLIATGLLVAATGKRRALAAWLTAFALLAVVGLVDFWRWEYDYGHNLDTENAIITVPGMSYQPPLIGSKQLLNFVATSIPDVGAIALGVSFLLGVAALLVSRRHAVGRQAAAVAAIAMIACTPGPREIAYGAEQCAYCRMTVTDSRFAAQVVLAKGKVQTFDSIECMLAFLGSLDSDDAPRQVVVSDFDHPARLVPAEQAWFVRATAVGSPMGAGVAAFDASADSAALAARFGAPALRWDAARLAFADSDAAHAGAGR
jgi:copper chaperone NosL